MNKFFASSALVLAMGLASAGSASAGGVKALFLGDYGNDAAVAATQADIIGGDARFDQVNSASLSLGHGLPTLAYLQQFDSVLIWTDSVTNNSTDLSNLLGDYVNGGGGVVISTFWGQEAGTSGGTLNSTGYNPLVNPTFDAYLAVSLGAYDAGDPLMQGVSSLSASQYDGDYEPGLDSGAVLVASWDNGRPLAAYNAAHNVVDITLDPMVTTLNHASGDYQRLFANGLAFAAGGAVPEPMTWALMLLGFGGIGSALRARRRAAATA